MLGEHAGRLSHQVYYGMVGQQSVHEVCSDWCQFLCERLLFNVLKVFFFPEWLVCCSLVKFDFFAFDARLSANVDVEIALLYSFLEVLFEDILCYAFGRLGSQFLLV